MRRRCRRHWWQILPLAALAAPVAGLLPVLTALAADFAPVRLVLLMSVVGLPLVSVMPVAGLPPVLAAPMADCRWGRRHRWQIIGTILGYRHLRVNFKGKIYVQYVCRLICLSFCQPIGCCLGCLYVCVSVCLSSWYPVALSSSLPPTFIFTKYK